jgi:hypothetical protein
MIMRDAVIILIPAWQTGRDVLKRCGADIAAMEGTGSGECP